MTVFPQLTCSIKKMLCLVEELKGSCAKSKSNLLGKIGCFKSVAKTDGLVTKINPLIAKTDLSVTKINPLIAKTDLSVFPASKNIFNDELIDLSMISRADNFPREKWADYKFCEPVDYSSEITVGPSDNEGDFGTSSDDIIDFMPVICV